MIHINGHNITGVYSGSKSIIAAYSGLKLNWSKLTDQLCCYANGYWMDDYPWADNTAWTD